MASEIKVNTIKKASGSSIAVGESGDTITINSGATITTTGTVSKLQRYSMAIGDYGDASTSTTRKTGKVALLNTTSATHI